MLNMKRQLALALLVLMAPAVGCGGDEDGATEGDPAPAPTSDFPLTVDHRFGTTTFDAAPERIVSLDDQWTDILVALDAPLVGAAENPSVEGGRFPWQELPHGVESIPVTDHLPLEAIAALQPDLIVVTYFAPDQATYDQLALIAPTVGSLGDAEVDTWQDLTAVAGQFLGDEEAASILVADTSASIEALHEELPALEGDDYALANYVPGDAIYVVADPDDGASQLFAQLGMGIDPDLLDVADGTSGRAQLSLEQISMLDSDVLLLLTNGADPEEIPGYDLLPAVTTGAVVLLDLATASALNTPSPLSIPYALDDIRPALDAAASA